MFIYVNLSFKVRVSLIETLPCLQRPALIPLHALELKLIEFFPEWGETDISLLRNNEITVFSESGSRVV